MEHKFHLNNCFAGEKKRFGDMALLQIGLLHCNSGDEVEPHLHSNLFELTIAVDGIGTVTTNNDAVTIKRGDIHLSYPFEMHAVKSDAEKPLKYLFCAFSTDDETLARELTQITENFKSAETRIFKNSSVTEQTELILNEINNSGNPFYERLIHSALSEIAILTVNAFKKDVSEKIKVSKAQEFCYQIMAYINNNVENVTSLKDLGTLFGYDYFYISKTFKSTVGQTLQNYYKSVRLQTAKTYLDENYTCTEIADKLNYSSVYCFSKAFKNQFGLSPSEYKKQQK